MKYIILGMVGIPVGGFTISALYHYWFTGTCIVKPDLSGIKLMYKKLKRKWLNMSQTKYLSQLARDPESGEIFYVGDGLRRNVGTSP